ncbi:hypothetical protein [Halorubrum laminariae]|uniref:DUF7979 domain-containing protein n=1 Tax=Halorubrum laminariae TaxID=1433523 RepID=A0ABD6C175_9EURY|nr:hypothetical protein [Halorubrum laminariae]
MRDTDRRIRIRRAGLISEDARVRHFDELDEDAQDAVRELAGRPQTGQEPTDLDDGDVVKFTDYYQIRAR